MHFGRQKAPLFRRSKAQKTCERLADFNLELAGDAELLDHGQIPTNLYIVAPWSGHPGNWLPINGVFEMRFFFHSGLTNDSGEDISSLTIKEKIRHIVDEEDSKRPLSDSAIAKLLKQQENIPIARRTVAKYREELKIPASTLRRRSLYGR